RRRQGGRGGEGCRDEGEGSGRARQGAGQGRGELEAEQGRLDGREEKVNFTIRRCLSLALLAALAGCAGMGGDTPRATASLQPTKNSKTAGTVDFYQTGDKVRMVANVSGLVPGREHGFHIHEAGDCSSGDGMSAKGHFNPFAKPHGNPSA